MRERRVLVIGSLAGTAMQTGVEDGTRQSKTRRRTSAGICIRDFGALAVILLM